MTGVVKSNKMTKALVVVVYSTQLHKKYNKRFKTKNTFAASCSDSSKFEIGQKVEIIPCKPVSKTIRFKVVEN